MKLAGVLLIILALAIGIVPQIYECQAQGRAPLKLENGKTVPMKCHWTAEAEIAVAVPLALVGVMTIASKRKESHQVLSILGVTLGLFTILLPTALIGVCMSNEMLCNSLMKPTLIFSGLVAMGISGFVLVRASLPEKRMLVVPTEGAPA